MGTEISITQIDHVQFAMPRGEEEKARSFYGSVLGLTELEKPSSLSKRGGCWFSSEGVHVHLGVDSEFSPARKAHVGFCVSGLDALAARLESRGYEVLWDEALPGRRRFYTNDCFGNRLEFLADGDGLAQR